jgi:hypothetical protein
LSPSNPKLELARQVSDYYLLVYIILSRQKSQLVVEQPERYNPSAAKQFAENSWYVPQSTSAAKAEGENKPVVAAVNRCATQTSNARARNL